MLQKEESSEFNQFPNQRKKKKNVKSIGAPILSNQLGVKSKMEQLNNINYESFIKNEKQSLSAAKMASP
jgi:hypothetical protein